MFELGWDTTAEKNTLYMLLHSLCCFSLFRFWVLVLLKWGRWRKSEIGGKVGRNAVKEVKSFGRRGKCHPSKIPTQSEIKRQAAILWGSFFSKCFKHVFTEVCLLGMQVRLKKDFCAPQTSLSSTSFWCSRCDTKSGHTLLWSPESD